MGYLYRLFGNTSSNTLTNRQTIYVLTEQPAQEILRFSDAEQVHFEQWLTTVEPTAEQCRQLEEAVHFGVILDQTALESEAWLQALQQIHPNRPVIATCGETDEKAWQLIQQWRAIYTGQLQEENRSTLQQGIHQLVQCLTF